jgi:hypothetical protein
MTREQITSEFTVDNNGIICNPGQFEGEMLYVPYFWDAYLNGMADGDEDGILEFDVNDDDRALFPELKDKSQVLLYQRSDGFVCER